MGFQITPLSVPGEKMLKNANVAISECHMFYVKACK